VSAAFVAAGVAFLTATLALLVALRTRQRLVATQAELAAANVVLDRQRQAMAESVASAHRETVEEVATLLDNLLAQVDTEVSAKVAEAMADRARGIATAETDGVTHAS
jgi:hypothetical protein